MSDIKVPVLQKTDEVSGMDSSLPDSCRARKSQPWSFTYESLACLNCDIYRRHSHYLTPGAVHSYPNAALLLGKVRIWNLLKGDRSSEVSYPVLQSSR